MKCYTLKGLYSVSVSQGIEVGKGPSQSICLLEGGGRHGKNIEIGLMQSAKAGFIKSNGKMMIYRASVTKRNRRRRTQKIMPERKMLDESSALIRWSIDHPVKGMTFVLKDKHGHLQLLKQAQSKRALEMIFTLSHGQRIIIQRTDGTEITFMYDALNDHLYGDVGKKASIKILAEEHARP
jgi:hypothetical protein